MIDEVQFRLMLDHRQRRIEICDADEDVVLDNCFEDCRQAEINHSQMPRSDQNEPE